MELVFHAYRLRFASRSGLHPEHPTVVEGCRLVSRGYALELMTWAKYSRAPCYSKIPAVTLGWSSMRIAAKALAGQPEPKTLRSKIVKE